MFLIMRVLLILGSMINSSFVFSAASIDYVFAPEDQRHVLYVPDHNTRSPAILLLHASTGIEKVNYDWATRLKDRGYVVYMIDSFKPRGWEDRRSVGWEKATQAQLEDVLPAYEYLRQLPYVDASRIGILGFSMGGFDVLNVMEANPASVQRWHNLPFKAAASFYPVCHRIAASTQLRKNTKVFIGEDDDRAPTSDCIRLIKNSHSSDNPVSILIYPNALHGFDNFEFPESKEIVDEQGEHYHIGFNEQARQKSLKDLPDFFDAVLK
ncbi:dienelactone hydrolase family protein [Legionella worsleiensis]|uniref:Dienelactone hydrolase family protein n=1 Tax=Legionella worsleiensis TaxID=45076 RepID=A0A0W1AL31_9GAMM|nr:dienelactone hydrolase family protein [Legionella worsleiensis]KTD82060.1 dienelactone hydrolase family protein [Legionella worsleiensis]STY30246.1 dienelactone hydrolase family protein [Legionella worsleiensis]